MPGVVGDLGLCCEANLAFEVYIGFNRTRLSSYSITLGLRKTAPLPSCISAQSAGVNSFFIADLAEPPVRPFESTM